jgi:hypothetical protein
MKKITIFAIVAAVCATFFLTSCSKDINTRTANFTITNDMWEQRSDNNYYCDFEWSAITDDALSVGNVNAYLILSANSTDYQEPLPYVYLRNWTLTDPATGAPYQVYQPVNVRFDIYRGHITFMVSDLGDLLTLPNELKTMRFRGVVTYPVEY